MAKGNFRRLFFRIIKSLNIEERIISLLLCIVIVITSIHGITDFVRSGGIAFAEGGSFVEGIISVPPALLNPVYAQTAEANRDVSALIFSGLVKYNPDSESFVGDLADYSLSEDKKTYTFTLKPNIVWHDGTPFHIDDVLFTYQQVIQNESFQNRLLKTNFDGVTLQKLNDQQVSFTLSEPNSFFISNFSVGILPFHLLKDLSVEELKSDQFNFHPIGTGPYKVEQSLEILNDGRQRLMLKSFDHYYGIKPKISVIRFNFYPDQEVMANDLTGLNLIAKIPMNKLEKIQTSHRFNFIEYELPQYTALFFNLDRENVKNVSLRKALSLSLDRNEIIKNLEYKKLINSPLLDLNQEEFGSKPELEESVKIMKGLGYAPSTPENDKAKLKQVELKLMVRSYDPESIQYKELDTLTNYFRSQWAQLGVGLVVEPEDEGAFNDRLGSKDYDMVLLGQNLGYNGDIYSFWHSTQAGENGLNLSNYRSFAVDNFIEKIRLSFDKEERMNLMKVLAATINEDYPAIFLYQPSYLLATDDKVKDISMQNLAYPSDRYSMISQWCIVNCQ